MSKLISIRESVPEAPRAARASASKVPMTAVPKAEEARPESRGLPSAEQIAAVMKRVLSALSPSEREGVLAQMASSKKVPFEIDSKLLATCRAELGRNLEDGERRWLRRAAKEQLQGRASS